ncbi:putative RNA methyltransferase [Salinifilum ghardaiensis]
MLDDVVGLLACPHCGGGFVIEPGRLCCEAGHGFDFARQGYVNLATGSPSVGDSAEMVAARAAFLAAGHYEPVTELLAAQVVAHAPSGPVVDVGAGTGHYLARVLDRRLGEVGLALDASKYACRRAARIRSGAGAVVADTWRHLPVRGGAAAAVLNVFAPRNAAELHRVLRPEGRLFVVTPQSGHLAELVRALGLLTVGESKQGRLERLLGAYFAQVDQRPCAFRMRLGADEVRALAAMGPSARHLGAEELAGRAAELGQPAEVSAAVTLGVYRPRAEPRAGARAEQEPRRGR